jgi:hypothetical protein
MLRQLVSALSLAVLCVSCAPTGPTYFGFEVGVTDAPPPPHFAFHARPRLVVVPGMSVYVVEDAPSEYDMFYYGSHWYVCYEGYWYRSRHYDAGYRLVDVRSVPRRVVSVPAKHWRHHPHGGPPGQMKKRNR